MAADLGELEAVAMEKAQALARAIAESATYKMFKEAQGRLTADATVSRRFSAYQAERQRVEFARREDAADPSQETALEEEWRGLSVLPMVQAYLAAQAELTALLREMVIVLNEEFGVDYGAVCTPPERCCG